MSYITRTGNLAETPTLREGDSGPCTYAHVIVSDRIRQDDGSYTDGPAIAYGVAVSGNQAANLVEAAERAGNIRVDVLRPLPRHRVPRRAGHPDPARGTRRRGGCQPARPIGHRGAQHPRRQWGRGRQILRT